MSEALQRRDVAQRVALQHRNLPNEVARISHQAHNSVTPSSRGVGMDDQEIALCTRMHQQCIAMARLTRLDDDPMHAHWLDAAARYRQLVAWRSALTAMPVGEVT